MTDLGARIHLSRYLSVWLDDLASQSDEFKVPIDELVGVGCDRLRLAWLLLALQGAQHWRPISGETITKSADALEEAATAARTLCFSQLNPFLFEPGPCWLESELRDLAKRARHLAAGAHARRPMARDLLRATLVRYVQRTTGQFHDDQLAALISVVESLNETDSISGTEPVHQTNYTAEAHVQWRQRPSCQDLLRWPSEAVNELEERMEQDLAEMSQAPVSEARPEGGEE